MVIEELSKLDDRVTSKAAVLMKYPGLIISRDSMTWIQPSSRQTLT